MASDLIVEIGTEELPPSCTRKGLEAYRDLLEKNLKSNHIGFKDISAYSSPRRLTVLVKGVNPGQDMVEKVVTGPPVKIAFGPDGKPNKAAEGFARSLGLKVGDLDEIELKGKGVYLGKKMVQKGGRTKDVLPGMLKDTIMGLSFNKQMTWGDYDIRFIRPIRWLLALLGREVIRFGIENVQSGNITYGHRTLKALPIKIKSADEYFTRLEKEGNVIADPAEREKMVYKQVEKIENKWKDGRKAVIEKGLLDDIVDLVEIPNVLEGSFPDDFLYIPPDILTEAIQYHQKYFPVKNKKGRLTTDFLIVQNGLKDSGGIRQGNERVLKARLSDAAFFYEQDKKHGFNSWAKKLDGVIFYSKLGSMNDKQNRLSRISEYIIRKIGKDGDKELTRSLRSASHMCKCDLVTNMVVEFPELQGVVGTEYARERGFDDDVSGAIFEHYLPRFAGDSLPKTETGRILSIADKADTITGMFLAGNVPSGSEDPFALRRRAAGMVRSILDGGYDIGLKGIIEYCSGLYSESFKIGKKAEDIEKIFDFIQARQKFSMAEEGRRMDVLEAVLGSGCSSVLDIGMRCEAIWKYIEKKDIKSIVWPMARSKNIAGKGKAGPVDSGLFTEEHEKKLYDELEDVKKKSGALLAGKKYGEFLGVMEKFGKTVDVFFDEVLVMDKDEKVRDNRISLLCHVVDLYMSMADFSCIVIEDE